jgi:hypothetical protein
MRFLGRLFGRGKRRKASSLGPFLQAQKTQEPPRPRPCRGCGRDLPPVVKVVFDEGDTYCPDCARANAYVAGLRRKHGSYEVFVYSQPENAYIRSYAPPWRQWLPTYQADTGGFALERTVARDAIPSGAMFGPISAEVSQHGSFTHYGNLPAFVAVHQPTGLLCAYVPEDTWRSRFTII